MIGLSVWVSGVLYWTYDHYMLRHTDIGISENPLQVWWLYLHAGTATAAIWLLGYMSAIHVQRNWGGGQRRNSGLLFVSTVGVLVVTGYLLYYVDADRPEALISSIHWIVGLCAPAAFLLHRSVSLRRAPSSSAAPGQVQLPAQAALPVQGPMSAQAVQPSLPVHPPL